MTSPMQLEKGLIVTARLPINLTNGNDGRGSKWFSNASARKSIEKQLRQLHCVRKPFDHPVRLRITRILGKGQRLWDADSILRGSAKELIDALVACGWFVDDAPKWITEVDGRQDDTQRHAGPLTLIEVFKCEQ